MADSPLPNPATLEMLLPHRTALLKHLYPRQVLGVRMVGVRAFALGGTLTIGYLWVAPAWGSRSDPNLGEKQPEALESK